VDTVFDRNSEELCALKDWLRMWLVIPDIAITHQNLEIEVMMRQQTFSIRNAPQPWIVSQ